MEVKTLVQVFVEQSGVVDDMTLMDALKVVHSRISLALKVHTDLKEKFVEWGIGSFVFCPHCASETLLEFGGCHWCNFPLLDSTKPSPEVETSTKTKKSSDKNKKVESKQLELAEDIDETVDELEDVNEEEVPAKKERKKRGPNKSKANAETKEVEKPKKSKEEPKKEKVADKRYDNLKTLQEMIKTAESKETELVDLKKINEISKTNVEMKKFKKVSEFRAAIVEALTEMEQKLANELSNEEKEAKRVAEKNRVVEANKKNAEILKGKTKAKVVEVDESELEDDLEGFDDNEDEEQDEDIDLESDVDDLSLDDIDVNVDDLEDEEFDLDE